jgi:hypothetical protein
MQISGLIGSWLRLATDTLIVIAVVSVLAWRDPLGMVALSITLGIAGFLVAASIKPWIQRAAEDQSNGYAEAVGHVYDAFGALREARLLDVSGKLLSSVLISPVPQPTVSEFETLRLEDGHLWTSGGGEWVSTWCSSSLVCR